MNASAFSLIPVSASSSSRLKAFPIFKESPSQLCKLLINHLHIHVSFPFSSSSVLVLSCLCLGQATLPRENIPLVLVGPALPFWPTLGPLTLLIKMFIIYYFEGDLTKFKNKWNKFHWILNMTSLKNTINFNNFLKTISPSFWGIKNS